METFKAYWSEILCMALAVFRGVLAFERSEWSVLCWVVIAFFWMISASLYKSELRA